MSNELYVHHHLGLGDHIDCNAMIRIFLEEYDFDVINVFVKERYSDMIKYMYRDEPNIKPTTVPNEDEYATILKFIQENNIENFLKVGHEFYPWGKEEELGMGCAEIFYNLVNIPYERRFDDFYYERDKDEEQRVYEKLNPEDEDYIFVHDDASRGFEITKEKIKEIYSDDIKIIRNDITENLFNFGMILEKAKQIHCMESAFRSLVEVLDTTDELFFHNLRKGASGYLGNSTSKEWIEVKYNA
jgi:hypothetical protein